MRNETVGVSYGDLNYKSVNQWTTFHIVYLGGLCFPFSFVSFHLLFSLCTQRTAGLRVQTKNPIVRKKMNGLGSNK